MILEQHLLQTSGRGYVSSGMNTPEADLTVLVKVCESVCEFTCVQAHIHPHILSVD